LGGAHLIGYRFNTEITIRNNGAETINSFSVHSDLGGIFGCIDGIFHRKFEDEEILPGQTFTLTLTRLLKFPGSTICFECLAPNSMLEIQISNNSLCKEFVDTGIPGQTQPGVKVYPNPVSDWLIIDFECSGHKRIELYDISGRRVYINEGLLDQEIIDLKTLKPGIYILNIISDKRHDTRKIIKN
jgi:hypothetical protein